MSYFERTIELENIAYTNIVDRKIIFSKNGKKFIASKKINDKWVPIRESTSYNVCYNLLHDRK